MQSYLQAGLKSYLQSTLKKLFPASHAATVLMYRAGVHNRFSTAGRVMFSFMNYGRQWVQDIFIFALLLFCFHASVWPSFY